MSCRRFCIALMLLFIAAVPARAVIMRLIPLSDVVEKEQHIFVAKVAEVLPDKPGMVLVPDEDMKGKAPFERMPVNLTGDQEAQKGKHTEVLLDRIEKGTPIVVITSKRGGKYQAFGFTNGTWFQMDGRVETQDGKEVVRWSFLHCEPYLRRTFKGTTEELKQVVADALAKKKAPPEPDQKEPPGYGPAIKKNSGVAFPLAVIQLPFLGLIAALAALFPTVFGGLALFMKRWVAALSTSGLVSIFIAVPLIWPGWAAKQWAYSPSGLWFSAAILFSLGALWSVRRYRISLDRDGGESMQPRKFDRTFAGLLFLAGIVALGIGYGLKLPVLSNDYWRWTLAGTLGLAAGSWVLFNHYRRYGSEGPALRLPAETALLWVVAATCVAYGSWEAGRFSRKDLSLVQGAGGIGQPVLQTEPLWSFAPPVGGTVVNSCATPERLYAAVMVAEGFDRFGRVYALDPKTGAEVWQFDNEHDKDADNGMKPAFSAPVFADGRLYFGEGLHTDKNSRLFCLDAATGKKLWEYTTESHTESTPVVADGKVVIGAGYHGLHCVDAIKGPGDGNKPLWRYPAEGKADDKLEHVDGNPAIADGRVYAGSGFKPDYVKDGKVNKIFCLDLNTGTEVWSERTEDSVYGSPLVSEGQVFFGTGNSTYSETIPSKRPGVLCRDAATGREVWSRVLPEGVLGRPAADRFRVYVGCLDGKAYALDRRTGGIRWSVETGGPILADPVLNIDDEMGIATLYVVGKNGTVYALSPPTGAIFWSIAVNYWTDQPVEELSATPTILRTRDGDEVRRQLFVGFAQKLPSNTVPRLLAIEDRTRIK